MKQTDLVVLTDSRWIAPKIVDAYTENVLTEDGLVVDALREQGLRVERKAWDDPNFEWSSTRSVLFRTTWDYFDRFTEFSKWLNKISSQTRLFNSEKLIKWNLDKHYLLDLSDKKVHITPTRFIEKDENIKLSDLLKNTEWYNAVLKPCVSGAARHTYKISEKNVAQYETIFKELLKQEALMLQPFQHNIVEEGELSLMIIDGRYTHAILKKAKPGDFRVQDDFGGSVHDYTPTREEIAFAENAVKNCIESPLYARVDMFTDNDDKLAVSELELIEPELWFRFYPKAAVQLAKAIARTL
ncbi:RimK family alpha-L-glutamate ligase [Flavobacteriaceae bacterium M23B6Z8]